MSVAAVYEALAAIEQRLLSPVEPGSMDHSQVGKLRDVADDLVLQTIETYAKVGSIHPIVEAMNQLSREYVAAKPGNEKADAQSRLSSSLRVMGEEINKTVPKIDALVKRLAER
jgi:hypothetical protein